MFNFSVNLFSVFVSGIAAMFVGGLWYSPMVFGTYWMSKSGIAMPDKQAAKKEGLAHLYAGQFVLSCIGAYVLAHFVGSLGVISFGSAFQLAFWLWIGVQFPLIASSALWEKKPWGLVCINAGGNLLSMVVMTTILAYWR